MPDLCLIPDIAAYFGITLDEMFEYTPGVGKEMQIEMYFQVMYHLLSMLNQALEHGLLVTAKYIEENEVHPLIHQSVIWMCDGISTDILTLWVKNKCKNEYVYKDENLIDLITTGIKYLAEGQDLLVTKHVLISYLPKNISKAVSDRIEKEFDLTSLEVIWEEGRK